MARLAGGTLILRHPVLIFSSLLLAAALCVGSFWLAWCGDWSSSWWCEYGHYALTLTLWPVKLFGPFGLLLGGLFYAAIFFVLQLYVARKIHARNAARRMS
jgi:hypothetical protein